MDEVARLRAMLDGAYAALVGAEQYADAHNVPIDFSDALTGITDTLGAIDAWVEEQQNQESPEPLLGAREYLRRAVPAFSEANRPPRKQVEGGER